MYYRTDSRGHAYMFTEDTETLAGWSDFGSAEAHDEDFRTVATRPLDREEGVAFGRGNSENPERAEAYKYLDAQDGGASAITAAAYRVVILNAANKVVAVIDRGRLDEVNKGDPSTDARGDYGKPFKYRTIAGGKGEVLGGSGHKVALQIKLDSGTATFSTANSTMKFEGYSGTLEN